MKELQLPQYSIKNIYYLFIIIIRKCHYCTWVFLVVAITLEIYQFHVKSIVTILTEKIRGFQR